MPKSFQYRSGSLIYFQGDPAEKIYILQNGKVSLVYQDIETKEDIRDFVQPGEFFGVKSALGRFPREENAIALSDTAVMAFTVPEFEAFAMQNSRIIMKMLKVFSNQMRRIHKQVSSLMEKEEEAPSEGLFKTGEYYYKTKRLSFARHVFSRYLTFYPSGRDALAATKYLETIERSGGISVGRGGGVPNAAALRSSSSETRDFDSAMNLVSQGKYQEAIVVHKSIVDNSSDADTKMQSAYEIGNCMFLMKKFEECIRYCTNMLTQYPRHQKLKETMFIIGQCNEILGRADQAQAFYKKLISMGAASPGDETIQKAKRALEALGA